MLNHTPSPISSDLSEPFAYISAREAPLVHDLMLDADKNNKLLIQPRCGVGSHHKMLELLKEIESHGRPDILTITVDSYTRLLHFDTAHNLLHNRPEQLNGYPVVSHGWERTRELLEAVRIPLQIRHGSPDPRILFDVSLKAGIDSFEGGGIGYNLPYCKDVPLQTSLRAWDEIDAISGEWTKAGIPIDREFFGSLTGCLIPPSLAIATTYLEAILAARRGVMSLSIAIGQSGNLVQDIAALRAIRELAPRYLPARNVFPVLHQYMGPFPRKRTFAESIIIQGSIAAKLGRAVKLINKTREEAHGVPTVAANVDGIMLSRASSQELLQQIPLDDETIEEELYWIKREVSEMIEPILQCENTIDAIVAAFASGSLDIPFCPSRFCKGDILTFRDKTSAIRYLAYGGLPFSDEVRSHNTRQSDNPGGANLYKRLQDDLMLFAN